MFRFLGDLLVNILFCFFGIESKQGSGLGVCGIPVGVFLSGTPAFIGRMR